MPLPAWDAITTLPEWEELTEEQQRNVFNSYKLDIGKEPAWSPLSSEQKFNVVRAMEEDAGFYEEAEGPSLLKDVGKTVKGTAEEVGKNLIGGIEALAASAGGMVQFFGGGAVAGIPGMAKYYSTAGRTGDVSEALRESTKTIEEIQQAIQPILAYEPQTKEGIEAKKVIDSAFQFLIGTPSEVLGNVAQDITTPVVGKEVGSGVAAVTKIVTELGGYSALFGSLRGGKKVDAKKFSPVDAAEFEKHLADTAKVVQKALPEGAKVVPEAPRVTPQVKPKPTLKEELVRPPVLDKAKIPDKAIVEPGVEGIVKGKGGVLKLNKSQKHTLKLIEEEVATGEAGSRTFTDFENVPGGEWTGTASSFPDYFKNKGYTKKETLNAIDKALKGKPLGKRQQMIVEDLNSAKRADIATGMRTLEERKQFRADMEDIDKAGGGAKEGITEMHMGVPVHKIIPKKWRTKWQEFWEPFSTVPEGERFKFERTTQKGSIGRAEDIVQKFHDKLKPFDLETKKDVFRFLDDRISLEDLPTDVRTIAKGIQQKQITIGKMLVKRGIISKEAFEKHKGKYVHYMFAKHILGDKEVGLGPAGKLNLSYTKSRNPDLTLEQRQALGLIEDASVAVPVGMGKALVDVTKFDYLQKITDNPKWVWKPSVVDVGGKKMGIGKLAEEVEIFRKVVEKQPDNIATRKQYDTLNATLQKAMEETRNVPEEFVQLPSTKSYGPLAGTFVRKPIADDLRPIMGSTKEWGSLVNTLLSVEQQGMALFKATHVALNFPTAFRNTISNILQNNMRGRPLNKIPGDFVDALKSVKAKDQDYTQARRHGLFKTNWAVTEINEILNEFAKVSGDSWASFMGGVKNAAKYYGKIDDIAKHTIYVQLRKEGVPIDKAILEAQKWGMDYSLASRSVKGLRRHFVPFISYQYKIAPLIMESLQKRPWVIGKYAALPFIAQEAAKYMNDISDEEWKKLKKDLPFYIKKNKTSAPLPVKDPDGRWQWVNLEYYFPWGNWMSIFRDLKEQDFGELYDDTGIGNPFMDLAMAMSSKGLDTPPLDPFTRQPIYNKLDSPAEQWSKIAEFLYTKWAPSMLTRHGAAGYTASIGQEDKWGRKITPGQAVSRWFGLNITAISPKQTKAIKKGMINDLRKELYKISSDPSTSKEKKKAAKRRFIERRKEIIQGIP